jgi:ribosome-associated protein
LTQSVLASHHHIVQDFSGMVEVGTEKQALQTVEDSIANAKLAARAAAENKGQDIVLLDISKQTSIFDCFLIVTGTSRRQLHAIAEEIHRVLKERGETRLRTSGYDESRWIAIDYGGIVIHLFDEECRKFYDLEGLWADGIRIDLSDTLRDTSARVSQVED